MFLVAVDNRAPEPLRVFRPGEPEVDLGKKMFDIGIPWIGFVRLLQHSARPDEIAFLGMTKAGIPKHDRAIAEMHQHRQI